MTRLRETPSQTAGPYLHIGCLPNAAGLAGVYPADPGDVIAGPGVEGQRIALVGHVIDGAGAPVTDALVEAWQADAQGRFPGQPGAARGFAGWGRSATGATGAFRFDTVRPGPVPFGDGRMQNPHVTLWIAARGINLALVTRLYFPEDDPTADPVLRLAGARGRTMISRAEGTTYRLDIHLQGPGETVFLDI